MYSLLDAIRGTVVGTYSILQKMPKSTTLRRTAESSKKRAAAAVKRDEKCRSEFAQYAAARSKEKGNFKPALGTATADRKTMESPGPRVVEVFERMKEIFNRGDIKKVEQLVQAAIDQSIPVKASDPVLIAAGMFLAMLADGRAIDSGMKEDEEGPIRVAMKRTTRKVISIRQRKARA
jgi:hypothetical protein